MIIRRTTRRLAAAVAVAGTALGLATAVQPAQAAATEYVPPAIKWHTCAGSTLASAHARCGFLIVPLDYAHPGGRKIKVAVSRVRHTVSARHYQGVMIVNPGGPGGSGLDFPAFMPGWVPGHVANDYDWIGFDPRGVGASRPALSCDPKFFTAPRPAYRPSTAALHRAWVARSRHYAAACANTATKRALLQHVRTVDTVRDLESLRIALHQKKINYYGFSYGTYLGQVYATMHPDRVRRFVWDGTVNPHRVFYRDNQDQDRAFQRTFDIFFGWLAKYPSVFHLGTSAHAIADGFRAEVAKLDKAPAAGALGGDELIDALTDAGYYVYNWTNIGKAYADLINSGNGKPLLAMYRNANPTGPGDDNSYAMYLATQCTDAPWPRSQKQLDADNWKLDEHYDYFTWSNAWFNGPCAYWHAKVHPRVTVTGRRVRVRILMIGETYDAATPFSGSLVVRGLFPTARLIEGRNGSTHAGSLSGVSCTDDTIARYLATGALPRRRSGDRADKICPPVPQPDPTKAPARLIGSPATASLALPAR